MEMTKHIENGLIGFGTALRYHSDRGFGFVSNVLKENKGSYFLHISVVKKMSAEKAQTLENDLRHLTWHTRAEDKQYFWYVFEPTTKGLQVVQILSEDEVESYKSAICHRYAQRIEALKKRIGFCRDYERRLLKTLMTADELNALESEAHTKNKTEVRGQNIMEFLQSLGVKNQQLKKEAIDLEEQEFQALVAEMRPLNFRTSSEVSQYITQHYLGRKYSHISGHLHMQNIEGQEYIFDGGIKSKWYARLCSELQLTDRRSGAIVTNFESYADIMSKQ